MVGALFRSWPGRLFVIVSAALALLLLPRAFVDLPASVDAVRRLLWIAWFGVGAWLTVTAISANRRAFLWRVRRKLLLSYLFLGVVPVALVVAFALAASILVYMTIASYVFRDAIRDRVEEARRLAEVSAVEIARAPGRAESVLADRIEALAETYPSLSMAVLTGPSGQAASVRAGPWAHGVLPSARPPWLDPGESFAGVVSVPAPAGLALVIRAAVPTADQRGLVVADLPVDTAFATDLAARTGTSILAFTAESCDTNGPATSAASASDNRLFSETAASLACTRWSGDGGPGNVSLSLGAPVGALYDRLAIDTAAQMSSASGSVLITFLVVLGVLFLVIQVSALVVGVALARSITWAVHELFDGTERIQHGDFAHRIRIDSRDQLGDLATSFNRMSSSVEHLLHVQREKQRLDDELRIARQIQRSLLPAGPPAVQGIEFADLCEPAREVGGDYYDFFDIGPSIVGVIIADVSGKGTSAALYMAELKGLMLALSHTSSSPRQLLIDVNKRLSEHLDNRSFITMTYVVIDLEQRVMTTARAGHTPMVVVSQGKGELVTPDGMVLGLRLPGAAERFESILDEYTRPIADGDIIVLYTDGITEATDAAGEMFGDAALVDVLERHHTLDAAGLREAVLRDVQRFVGEAEPHDDMTMVVMKVQTRRA